MLLEFSYTDDSSPHNSLPEVQECGYYLLVRGTIGHSGGYRPGASLELRGDTLVAAVDLYRASDLDPRDWTLARWTLRIGGLGPQPYHVTLSIGAKVVVRRTVKLTFKDEGCAA